MGFRRVPLFRKRQFAAEIIVTCVRWYLRFSLSLRDVEELMAERGLSVDHTTVWRWTQTYAPEVQRRLRGQVKPKGSTLAHDETFVRIAGRWMYLFRAVDSGGQTVDFYLSETRDREAADSASCDERLANPDNRRTIRVRQRRTAKLSRGHSDARRVSASQCRRTREYSTGSRAG